MTDFFGVPVVVDSSLDRGIFQMNHRQQRGLYRWTASSGKRTRWHVYDRFVDGQEKMLCGVATPRFEDRPFAARRARVATRIVLTPLREAYWEAGPLIGESGSGGALVCRACLHLAKSG